MASMRNRPMVASIVGLFADEGSEGLQAGVLYVYVWAVWHGRFQVSGFSG